MKIYLDLLPEGKKEEIRKNKIFLNIIRQEIMLTIPIASFAFILFFVVFCLNMKISILEENSTKDLTDDYKELRTYENKFKEINLKTSEVYNIQKNHLNWSNLFSRLSEVVGENVYLSDLTTDNYKISLAGKAKTRDDFLKFQERIKSDGCFENVDVPLSSLVSKENLEFQMDFEIKEECLKNNQDE